MKNRFAPGVLIGILMTVALAIIAGYAAVTSGLIPANADAKPSRIERWAAQTSLHATLRREAPKGPNPVANTEVNMLEGIKLYGQNCLVCHGASGAKPTKMAQGFYQFAPQLARRGVEDDPPGVTYWKITHGIRLTAMPSFARTLTDDQRWKLTLFLEHMDKLPPRADKAWHTMI